ncbi:hypothetical protein QYH69_20625 [Paraburkholderia sp. SARCC-3016]|jgi:hypothetical protein|uniref:hypothetical protein n=1 Tax=Paraburkholderia sp. SARCC-3016 TaxID=3058611 RepID=UPI002806D812|nr:hypothetical protein [Paraburkholderia sp. SARCC-3016]MDQ7979653.1 hypothetical protein [Paraburkholderia sp. SARCC-3016]
MNLQEQIGALEASVDDLIEAAAASAVAASATAASPAEPAGAAAQDAVQAESPASDNKPTLHIDRPNQNEIVMTIGDRSVRLHPLQVGQLIEELSNARASMQPEAPANLPPGWRFVSTKNPVMAVQKQSNGDRLLVMRHTGHGWVPFTFSPDTVIQLYMMLTQA